MLAYAIRRLILGLITLLLISFLVYALIRFMPGDPSLKGIADPEYSWTPAQRDQFRQALGLDRPWTIAYLEWLGGALSGDFGTSLHWHEPVGNVIGRSLGPTLLLSVTSLVLAYAISLPLGVYCARRAGKLDEKLVGVGLYALYSFPSYVMAILLLLAFSGRLPTIGMRGVDHDQLSAWGKLLDILAHMALPVVCYTYGALAYLTRFVRANMLEALGQDFIRMARAKGLPESTILWKHALRNAMIPFVTLVGLSLPALLGGSVILEELFAWPGIGRLFFQALGARDYTVLMGLLMTFSLLVVLGTLLADLLYAVVDPRISYR